MSGFMCRHNHSHPTPAEVIECNEAFLRVPAVYCDRPDSVLDQMAADSWEDEAIYRWEVGQ